MAAPLGTGCGEGDGCAVRVCARAPPVYSAPASRAGHRIRKAREVRRSVVSTLDQRDTAERVEAADSSRLATVVATAASKRQREERLKEQLRRAEEEEREAREEAEAAKQQLAAATAEAKATAAAGGGGGGGGDKRGKRAAKGAR
jgi:hypothetical protein